MRIIILFLLCFLTAQISYKIVPILAQGNDNMQEIKKVVEKFLDSYSRCDIDSMMSQVSLNYNVEENNNIIDYTKFKSLIEKDMNFTFKKYANYSINGLELYNFDIQDNKATAEIKYTRKAFNLNTAKDESSVFRRKAFLIKENSIWKIVRWIALEKVEPK